ncbi:hypothetical protein EDB86DRAFT_2834131 [Lactarius hatsudake]|nr:hypothetical protein EDB86DRAFT_2834131 [Lactarius hatsudake]
MIGEGAGRETGEEVKRFRVQLEGRRLGWRDSEVSGSDDEARFEVSASANEGDSVAFLRLDSGFGLAGARFKGLVADSGDEEVVFASQSERFIYTQAVCDALRDQVERIVKREKGEANDSVRQDSSKTVPPGANGVLSLLGTATPIGGDMATTGWTQSLTQSVENLESSRPLQTRITVTSPQGVKGACQPATNRRVLHPVERRYMGPYQRDTCIYGSLRAVAGLSEVQQSS